MSQTSRDRDNSRRVRTHEKNSGETVRRLGTIIQSIFCAQSGAGIRLNFWKWSGESRYPGALSPVMKTFVPPLLPTRPDRLPLGLRNLVPRVLSYPPSLACSVGRVGENPGNEVWVSEDAPGLSARILLFPSP